MKRLTALLALLGLWVSLASLSLHADVTVSPLFSDHAVLQKAAKVPVWGKAAPGEAVTVGIAGTEAKAVAGADGKWSVVLDLSAKGPGPFDLTIAGAAGSKPVVATDVLVGEVWVASGQSNMEFVLKNTTGAADEIAASSNPQFRQFLVKKKLSPVPLDAVEGAWVVAGPETAGSFTAVGYFFGKTVQKSLGLPFGLIHSSWGGTPVEGWTRREAIDSVPDLKEGAEKYAATFDTFPAKVKDYEDALLAWEKQNAREIPPVPADVSPYAGTAVTPSAADGWKTVKLPGTLAASGGPDGGAIWLRRTVTLAAADAAMRAAIDCGPIPGTETFYWNGVKAFETKLADGTAVGNRHLYLWGNVKLEAGEGVLAIRIACPAGGAAVPGSIRWGNLDLAGEWQAKAEKELPALSPEAKAALPTPPGKPPRESDLASRLYNGMIAPLIPYAIRGAIWYQGENNSGRGFQYRTAFPLMIADWRAQWGEGDFPFLFCQIANYQARATAPGDSNWAELRDAQTRTLSLPNTGMAVLIDCGDEGDIHPRDKKTPGERLAAIALANTYGKGGSFSGPAYASMAVEGDAVRVRFAHVGGADGALVAKPIPAEYVPRSIDPTKTLPTVRNSPQSPLEGFALCGEDHKWFWADAQIDGETVVVRSKDVPKPVAVRYAWSNDPLCNLYNGAGFPAVPFRSDDFPGVSDKAKF